MAEVSGDRQRTWLMGRTGVVKVAGRGMECELYSKNWICLDISSA